MIKKFILNFFFRPGGIKAVAPDSREFINRTLESIPGDELFLYKYFQVLSLIHSFIHPFIHLFIHVDNIFIFLFFSTIFLHFLFFLFTFHLYDCLLVLWSLLRPIYQSIHLSIRLSIYLPIHLYKFLNIYLSIFLSI